jgi:superfamily II RNA helicase
MKYRGFELYPFQEAAIRAIEDNRSVIVSAPTGAGKTLIAEYAIERCIERKVRVIYTSPIKTLSNQKFRDFRASYGDAIGIMTGDVTINPDAPVLIMTTEIFRNTLFESADRFSDVQMVIMDEIHYIGDEERGSVWEESIIFAPKSVRFVGLSATISNLEQFRAWVERVCEHTVDLVKTEERPVPLLHFLFVPETGPCRISDLKNVIPLAKQRKKNRRFKKHDVLDLLQRERKLPCLFFCFSRRECEARARANQRRPLLSEEDQRQVAIHFDDLGARYQVTRQRGFPELRQLASRGVLFHHAGMLPIYKEIVERLFTSGLIKLLFTTETFALGVNMPAKVVVFATLRKFDGVSFDYLPTLNYYQMAGRAGRQGIDSEGTVYSTIDVDYDTAKDVKRVIFSRIEPIISRFNLSYSSTLNLYGRMGQGIYDAVDRSFAAFQRGGSATAERAATRTRLEVLEKRGYIQGETLAPKGRFAAQINAYEIHIAELFWAGLFENLDLETTAILVVAIVFEARRGDLHERFESAKAGALKNRAMKRMAEFAKVERACGLEDSQKPLDFGLSAAVQGWMRGCRFEDLRNFTSTQDGDVVRNFRLAVQVLRQFAWAVREHAELHERLLATLARLNRDEVDAERQLTLG